MLKCECASDILVSHALDVVTPEKLFGVLIDKVCWLPCPQWLSKGFQTNLKMYLYFITLIANLVTLT